MRLPRGVRDEEDESMDGGVGWSVSSETKADTSDSDKVVQQYKSSFSSLFRAIDSGERGLLPLGIIRWYKLWCFFLGLKNSDVLFLFFCSQRCTSQKCTVKMSNTCIYVI